MPVFTVNKRLYSIQIYFDSTRNDRAISTSTHGQNPLVDNSRVFGDIPFLSIPNLEYISCALVITKVAIRKYGT